MFGRRLLQRFIILLVYLWYTNRCSMAAAAVFESQLFPCHTSNGFSTNQNVLLSLFKKKKKKGNAYGFKNPLTTSKYFTSCSLIVPCTYFNFLFHTMC